MWWLVDSETHSCPVLSAGVEDWFVSAGWHSSWKHNSCRSVVEGEIV